jgi:predicted amidophosphoribosyltransferase
MAERIVATAAPEIWSGDLVPVPPAPRRFLRRGFDPAAEIATALAACTGLPLNDCLDRRNGPRQVGRTRRERIGDPPRILIARPVPSRAVLVDDVCTTGATLSACASALRAAGTEMVLAMTFARALGETPRRA